MKPSFSIIGCGKVGSALAKYLAKAGYPPAGFSSKRLASARQAARLANAAAYCFENSWEAAKNADIVFITPPDTRIASTCRIMSEHKGFKENAVVLHCSGALASTELSSAKYAREKSRVVTASMHPLQSFAAVQTRTSQNPFENIMMAVEGDPDAVKTAREMAADLGAKPFTITTQGKILYHAAAVTASNYLVTLMELAFKLMAASGVSESDAFEILQPLILGTLKNIETQGIPGALTGPIARGDAEVVEKHMAAIRQLSGEMAGYYAANGLETIKIARKKGGISQDVSMMLQKIMQPE